MSASFDSEVSTGAGACSGLGVSCTVNAGKTLVIKVSKRKPAALVCARQTVTNDATLALASAPATIIGSAADSTGYVVAGTPAASCFGVSQRFSSGAYEFTITNTGPAGSVTISDAFGAGGTGETLGQPVLSGATTTPSCALSVLIGTGCVVSVDDGSGEPATAVLRVPVSGGQNATCQSLQTTSTVHATYAAAPVSGDGSVVHHVYDPNSCTPSLPTVSMVADGSDESKAYWRVTISNKGANPAARNGVVVRDANTDITLEPGSGCSSAEAGEVTCNVGANAEVTFRVSRPLSLLPNRCTGGTLVNALASAVTAEGTDLGAPTSPVGVVVPGGASYCSLPAVSVDVSAPALQANRVRWGVSIDNRQPNSRDQTLELAAPGIQFETGAGCGTVGETTIRCQAAGGGLTTLVLTSTIPNFDVCTGTVAVAPALVVTTASGAVVTAVVLHGSVTVPGATDVSCLSIRQSSTRVGAALRYAITIANRGPATSVVVRESISPGALSAILVAPVITSSTFAGACDVTKLQSPGCEVAIPPGETTVEVLSAAITNGSCSVATISGTASASWQGVAVNPWAAGAATVWDTFDGVLCKPQLAVSMSGPSSLALGATGTYRVQVRNVGAAATAGPIGVSLPVPTGVGDVTASGAGWVCAIATLGGLGCTASAALQPGESAPEIVVSIKVPSDRCPGLTLVATASGGGMPGSEQSSLVTTPVTGCAPVLTVEVHPTAGSIGSGQSFDYIVTVGNTGTADVAGVLLSQAPILGDIATVSSISGGCTVLPCTLDALSPGESVVVTVHIARRVGRCGAVDYSVSVTADGLSPTTDNDGNRVSVTGCEGHLALRLQLDRTNGDADPPTPEAAFGATIDGVTAAWNQVVSLTPGLHTLAASLPAGWTQAAAWVCPGAAVTGDGDVSVGAGTDVECTIAMASQPARVTVQAVYIPHGDAAPTVSVSLNGTLLAAPHSEPNLDTWTLVEVRAGAATAVVSVPAGWALVSFDATGCSAAPGQSGVLVLRTAPGGICGLSLTIERETGVVVVHLHRRAGDPDDGTVASGTVGSFAWGPLGIGAQVTMDAVPTGAHAVGEGALPNGWRRLGSIGSFARGCPSDPADYAATSVAVAPGAVAHVCLYHERVAQKVTRTLTVGKVVLGVQPNASTTFVGLVLPGNLAWALPAGGVATFSDLDAGVLTVTETSRPGYVVAGFRTWYDGRTECPADESSFDGSTSGFADLASRENALVCVYSRPFSTVRLALAVFPADDPARFDISLDGALVIALGSNGAASGRIMTDPGTHSISASVRAGTTRERFTLSVACGPSSAPNLVLSAGDEAACTVFAVREPAATKDGGEPPSSPPPLAPPSPPPSATAPAPGGGAGVVVAPAVAMSPSPGQPLLRGPAPLPPNTGRGTASDEGKHMLLELGGACVALSLLLGVALLSGTKR